MASITVGSLSVSESNKFIVRIGISGHQKLGAQEATAWTQAQIEIALNKKDFYSGITSLAEGADQLFGQVVLDLGRSIEVVIPCDHYEDAFTNAAAARLFRQLKQRALYCHSLPFSRPSEEAFYEAGKRVVQMSDLLIAVWNGKPAAGLGGTADIVKYALESAKEVLHINPFTLTTQTLEAS